MKKSLAMNTARDLSLRSYLRMSALNLNHHNRNLF